MYNRDKKEMREVNKMLYMMTINGYEIKIDTTAGTITGDTFRVKLQAA